MRVKIKCWNGVATWLWVANDENCGICRMAFNGCCPDCERPAPRAPRLPGSTGAEGLGLGSLPSRAVGGRKGGGWVRTWVQTPSGAALGWDSRGAVEGWALLENNGTKRSFVRRRAHRDGRSRRSGAGSWKVTGNRPRALAYPASLTGGLSAVAPRSRSRPRRPILGRAGLLALPITCWIFWGVLAA